MSDTRFFPKVADEVGVALRQVESVAALLADGGTVPFIARYRKEATGGLDEVQIIAIRDRLEQLKELNKRKEAILASLREQEKLTPDLEAAIERAETMSRLEDLYLPYRPKRRTRGMIAMEKGLEPLAKRIFEQSDFTDVEADAFIDPEKEVETREDAIAGAKDIIAEWINENSEAREELRKYFLEESMLTSKVLKAKEEERDAQKYKDYFEWTESLVDAPSHRILAVRRGAEEGFLTIRIQPDEDHAVRLLQNRFCTGTGEGARLTSEAAEDAYRRLLSLSMETEARSASKKRADQEAIEVFAENLRELLLASPLGQKALLALDPGFRTGCKLVVLSSEGALLHHEAIYPLEPHLKTVEAEMIIRRLVKKYGVEGIAIGNGTGGREAVTFCKGLGLGNQVPVIMVNESGASVYSASAVAREEFPKEDITVRGAVSIGRRLMDPLAELVKIDPKSIGVGQYQHDVDQKALKGALDDVVVSCVNGVGVDLNTASKELLKYVSGLSDRIASNIVSRRDKDGAFTNRAQLLDISGMGPKTFEQSAGFLRIRNGENPLDGSAVHPERYALVESMAADLGCSVTDLIRNAAEREKIELSKYVSDAVGLPTLEDIVTELARPGRDPRSEFELFSFTEGVNTLEDLQVGMRLPGVVTNVTNFGAFVDIGVHQDGLVHLSQMADHFVRNPHDEVKVNQKVRVCVLEVDLDRNRISLSMKSDPELGEKSGTARKKHSPSSRPRSGGKRVVKVKKEAPKNEYSSDNPFVDFFQNKYKSSGRK